MTQPTALRRVDAADKAPIARALDGAGITGRLRVFRNAIRVVFEGGDVESVARILNESGHRHASGRPFTCHAFQDGREVRIAWAVRSHPSVVADPEFAAFVARLHAICPGFRVGAHRPCDDCTTQFSCTAAECCVLDRPEPVAPLAAREAMVPQICQLWQADAGAATREAARPMSVVEAHAALAELKREIGPKADVWVSLSTSESRDKPLYAAIYATGLGQREPNFSCAGDDLGQIVADLRTGWEGFQAEHARRMIADMALEIIRITDEQGSCTDAALRGSKFSVGDVKRWGADACAKANEMAGRGPFEIVAIGGANGKAA